MRTRVMICSENISMRMGGEGNLAFHYFKLMRDRGLDVHAVCHSRVRDELRAAFPEEREFARFHFIRDTSAQVLIWRLGRAFPYRIRDLFLGQWIHFSTMRRAQHLIRQLTRELEFDIVFEPAPITPKGLSLMYGLGVPVAIGPLCGGLDFPPSFQTMDSRFTRVSIRIARVLSHGLHRLFPGKLNADALIAANRRTREALPRGSGEGV